MLQISTYRPVQIFDNSSHENGVRQIKAKKNNIYDSYTLVLNIAIVTNQNCLEI